MPERPVGEISDQLSPPKPRVEVRKETRRTRNELELSCTLFGDFLQLRGEGRRGRERGSKRQRTISEEKEGGEEDGKEREKERKKKRKERKRKQGSKRKRKREKQVEQRSDNRCVLANFLRTCI